MDVYVYDRVRVHALTSCCNRLVALICFGAGFDTGFVMFVYVCWCDTSSKTELRQSQFRLLNVCCDATHIHVHVHVTCNLFLIGCIRSNDGSMCGGGDVCW